MPRWGIVYSANSHLFSWPLRNAHSSLFFTRNRWQPLYQEHGQHFMFDQVLWASSSPEPDVQRAPAVTRLLPGRPRCWPRQPQRHRAAPGSPAARGDPRRAARQTAPSGRACSVGAAAAPLVAAAPVRSSRTGRREGTAPRRALRARRSFPMGSRAADDAGSQRPPGGSRGRSAFLRRRDRDRDRGTAAAPQAQLAAAGPVLKGHPAALRRLRDVFLAAVEFRRAAVPGLSPWRVCWGAPGRAEPALPEPPRLRCGLWAAAGEPAPGRCCLYGELWTPVSEVRK